jgi:hypothetical protein
MEVNTCDYVWEILAIAMHLSPITEESIVINEQTSI